jgi:LacI family transcriptional regulator
VQELRCNIRDGFCPILMTDATPKVVDVAERAAVSTATVSRVLNRPESVRPEVRARVLRVIEELGYVPNAGARALSLNRSGNIGLIIPTIDNAIFANGIQAFQKHLSGRSYQMLLATSEYDIDKEMQQAINLVSRGVEALALFGRSQRPELVDFLRQRRLPYVHVGVDQAPHKGHCIGFDNQTAMDQVVRYLVDMRHTRIAMIAGVTENNDRAMDRVKGVRRALKAHGRTLPAHYLVERPYQIESAREAMRELLELSDPPTAVICGNDVLALGALIEANRMGVAVPRQLSVVGFDDLEISRHFVPSLTTVRVPTEQMWERAADYLDRRLRGELAKKSLSIDVSLIVRESTGPAPK